MFQAEVVEEVKKHVLGSVTFFFFLKWCRLWDNEEKYRRAGQATDESVALS